MKRSAMFVRSDIESAAELFVEELSEHAQGKLTESGAVVLWEQGDRDALTQALTEAGLQVISDPAVTFGAVGGPDA